MKVLLDNNVDQRFGALLVGHEVKHCRQLGWHEMRNGVLLKSANDAGFDAFVTADKQMRHQQNLTGLHIRVVVLSSLFVDFAGISPLAPAVLTALENSEQGHFLVIK